MLFLILAVAASALVGFFFASTLRRYGILVALGLLAAVAVLVWWYLAAPTSDPGDCSDCGEYLGRWWEPGFAVFILSAMLIAWAGGLALGAGVREYRGSRGKPFAQRDRA